MGPLGSSQPCRVGLLPPLLKFTCCRHKFCFLRLSFESWVVQELALFSGLGENWRGNSLCFLLSQH
uniref:Uncharacterized protein n=1 Tax=Rhinopithecus bieti TaxID=61621 RepID=A0A2K6JP79_RHIBE